VVKLASQRRQSPTARSRNWRGNHPSSSASPTVSVSTLSSKSSQINSAATVIACRAVSSTSSSARSSRVGFSNHSSTTIGSRPRIARAAVNGLSPSMMD